MSTNHPTPRPWIVWQLAPDSDPQQRHIITTADGEHEITGIINREADAHHIVRCVNFHDELLAALKTVVDMEYDRDEESRNFDEERLQYFSSLIASAEGRAA